MYSLQREYGKIAKVGGLVGHPDLLFVFDGDEIRKIFKKEELLPHRYLLQQNYYSLSFFHAIEFTLNAFKFTKFRCFLFPLFQAVNAIATSLQIDFAKGLFR